MIHAKKILPEYFEASLHGLKPFELRLEVPEQPSYSVGDYIALNEYDPTLEPLGDPFTGRCLLYEITYVLRGHELLQPGAVILGLRLMPLRFEDLDSRRRS
jgi:hypothetical protein